MSAVKELSDNVVTKGWHYSQSFNETLKSFNTNRVLGQANLAKNRKQSYRNKLFARLFVHTGFNAIDALCLMGFTMTSAKTKSHLYANDNRVKELIDKELERVLSHFDAQIHKTVSELQLLRQEAMTVVIDKETGEPRMKCLDTALRCLELELQYFGGMKKLAMQNACDSMFVKPDEYEQSLIQEASD